MADFQFRTPKKSDHKDLLQILYDTGFYGETLKGHNLFEDKKLWGLFWLDYYLQYQTDNCVIAFDQEQKKVAGYIIGAADSQAYQYDFAEKMVPKIEQRQRRITRWRYPKTYKVALQLAHFFTPSVFEKDSYEIRYPGHLHMNVALNYQGHGLGTALMHRFEEKMKAVGVNGIHLGTTGRNTKAVPFYQKQGYKIVFTGESRWMGIGKETTEYYRMVKELF